MTKLNIDIVNKYKDWNIDEKDILQTIREIFHFYLSYPKIAQQSCLSKYDYSTISFDIMFCNGETTHKINKEYRSKDYPADIITFAVFADSAESERFVLDNEINLGEIIIAMDKIEQQANEKDVSKEIELKFFISHGILHLLGFDHRNEKEYNFVIECQKLALKSMGIEYDKI